MYDVGCHKLKKLYRLITATSMQKAVFTVCIHCMCTYTEGEQSLFKKQT